MKDEKNNRKMFPLKTISTHQKKKYPKMNGINKIILLFNSCIANKSLKMSN